MTTAVIVIVVLLVARRAGRVLMMMRRKKERGGAAGALRPRVRPGRRGGRRPREAEHHLADVANRRDKAEIRDLDARGARALLAAAGPTCRPRSSTTRSLPPGTPTSWSAT